MTVGDLIELLQNCPKHYTAVTWNERDLYTPIIKVDINNTDKRVELEW